MTSDSPEPDPSDEASPNDGDHPDVFEVGEPRRRPPAASRPSGRLRWLVAFVALGVIIVLQVVLLQRLTATEHDMVDVRGDIAGLKADAATARTRIDAVDEQLALAAASATPAAAESASVAEGSLPMFTDPATDPAVLGEYVLGDVTGVEYYSSAATTIAPADGKARVWFVWAHWCPYCQRELPTLAEWYPENADRFPNTELVTITTSMDEERGNPLIPYLEDSQFPFPVLMDEDLRLATQMGVSAFPFWVVTDPDGKVLFRVAGAIGVDAIEAIFTQVDELAGA